MKDAINVMAEKPKMYTVGIFTWVVFYVAVCIVVRHETSTATTYEYVNESQMEYYSRDIPTEPDQFFTYVFGSFLPQPVLVSQY